MRKEAPELLIGAHMSIAGGVPRAIDRAAEVGCTAVQIFVKSTGQWKSRPLGEAEVDEFRNRRTTKGLKSAIAHSSYLINLASPDRDLWRRSVHSFLEEMARSERLGLDLLVVHPGAHRDSGEEAGIRQVGKAINRIQEGMDNLRVRIALETTAGQGTSIGCRFEHLRDILGTLKKGEEVFVCMDTCHVFAAGYDLRTREEYDKTLDSFDRVVGLDRLAVFHLNDSKKHFGSRVDRHEHIGGGTIGLKAFSCLINDARFAALPKILETPKGDVGQHDQRNLSMLRSLVSNNGKR